MEDHPTAAEFRQTGFTADAVNYPHSDAGFRWLCRFNGISPEKAPRTWRYASSAGMRAYIQRKAEEDDRLEESGAVAAQAA